LIFNPFSVNEFKTLLNFLDMAREATSVGWIYDLYIKNLQLFITV
jgi:hypothetical protein